MKQVTQERILKAIERSSDYVNSKPETHIVKALASLGLKSVMGEQLGDNRDPFTDRDRLELAYQGFSDPQEILKRLSRFSAAQDLDSATAIKLAWFDSFERTIHRNWQRHSKIVEIQKRHGVSGLEKLRVDFGDRVIKYHAPHGQLALLDSELQVMYSERRTLAREFVKATRRHRMELYRHHNENDGSDWLDSNCRSVLIDAFNNRSVKLWTDKKYINYHELDENGYTTPKFHPVSVADELSLEFHLVATSSSDVHEDIEASDVWYCARLGRGKPSL